MKSIESHRGIRTNPNPSHETILKTTVNRFHQLTFSLPRIDDKKRWAGFPGNTGISRKLAAIIPRCITYVEPFAGTAKVYQELVKIDYLTAFRYVLNDKSKPIYKWLKKQFKWKELEITCTDFKYCIKKYDSKKTVFVIDHPWFQTSYDQIFSCFDRESVAAYDEEVLELFHSIKGKFFITTRKENTRMRRSGFRNLLIKSEYVVSGHYPEVLITTNVTTEDYN